MADVPVPGVGHYHVEWETGSFDGINVLLAHSVCVYDVYIMSSRKKAREAHHTLRCTSEIVVKVKVGQSQLSITPHLEGGIGRGCKVASMPEYRSLRTRAALLPE